MDYPCTNVFVTFEKEAHQRLVLSKLAVGRRHIRNNDISGLEDPKYAFEKRVVLNAKVAEEPMSMRWEDLNEAGFEKVKQLIFTSIFTLGCIVLDALAVTKAQRIVPGFGAAFTIAGTTV